MQAAVHCGNILAGKIDYGESFQAIAIYAAVQCMNLYFGSFLHVCRCRHFYIHDFMLK